MTRNVLTVKSCSKSSWKWNTIPRRTVRYALVGIVFLLAAIQFLFGQSLLKSFGGSYNHEIEVDYLYHFNNSKAYATDLGNIKTRDFLPYLIPLDDLEDGLPDFMRDYFAWHRRMRQEFPGRQLLDHSRAPKLLVKYCDGGKYGVGDGLYDRISTTLLHEILTANKTNRVLLFVWHQPRPLTEFLAPNYLDWSGPPEIHELKNISTILKNGYPIVGGIRTTALCRPYEGTTTIMDSKIVLYKKGLGCPFRKKGAALKFWSQFDQDSLLTRSWNIFFRPSARVQSLLENIWNTVTGPPGHYSAAHIRVLHPAFFNWRRLTIPGKTRDPDKGKMALTFQTQLLTVPPAIHALRCAMSPEDPKQPVYMLSDWRELAHHLYKVKKATTNLSSVNKKEIDFIRWTAEQMSTIPLVDPTVIHESAHMDALDQTWEAYAAAFVDIYVAAAAQCFSYGLGRFGYLASRIGRHRQSCINQHQRPTPGQEKLWNMWESTAAVGSCNLTAEYPPGIEYKNVYYRKSQGALWTH